MPLRAWEVEFTLHAKHGRTTSLNQIRRRSSPPSECRGTKAHPLGRPLVDTITGSRHANMKELRPGSTGRTEVRVLFAFDLERMAVLLVGGDKSEDWDGWYEPDIPVADERFDEHQQRLAALRREKTAKKSGPKGKGRR
jgi:hypothetical protein